MFEKPGFNDIQTLPNLVNKLNNLYGSQVEEQSGFKVMIDAYFGLYSHIMKKIAFVHIFLYLIPFIW